MNADSDEVAAEGMDAEQSDTGQRLKAAMTRATALWVIALSDELEALKTHYSAERN